MLPVTFISGAFAFSVGTTPGWLIFLSCLNFVIWCIARPFIYDRMMEGYSKEYTPVIGSLNQKIVDFGKNNDIVVPTPEGCVKMLSRYSYGKEFTDEMIQKTIGKYKFDHVSKSATSNTVTMQKRFCRNCGTQLQGEVGYCHMCGTKEKF